MMGRIFIGSIFETTFLGVFFLGCVKTTVDFLIQHNGSLVEEGY